MRLKLRLEFGLIEGGLMRDLEVKSRMGFWGQVY